jgi:hypothetical protein
VAIAQPEPAQRLSGLYGYPQESTACGGSRKRRLWKIGVGLYFTAAGLCHVEADKAVTRQKNIQEGSEGEGNDVDGYKSTGIPF